MDTDKSTWSSYNILRNLAYIMPILFLLIIVLMLAFAQWEWINRPSDVVFVVLTSLSVLIILFNYIYTITNVKDENASVTSYKVQEPPYIINNESNKYNTRNVNFTSTE